MMRGNARGGDEGRREARGGAERRGEMIHHDERHAGHDDDRHDGHHGYPRTLHCDDESPAHSHTLRHQQTDTFAQARV